MSINDRGIIKWLPAAYMPEQRAMLRELERDELRQPKPILDEYEIEELESRICYAMEFNFPVAISKWSDGFTYEEKGRIHYLDPIRKEVRMKSSGGALIHIKFADILAVEVIE
ncbi:YolD-like family protein [Bacillus massilinigeriensis]|uniref:YolD-like family protein n=1 Tax=Bacillus mediterraneensis TaxID=1805474 RepID=UPI0008F89134|nr:YolD-like family protein [Bacillus mediterraneensis]